MLSKKSVDESKPHVPAGESVSTQKELNISGEQFSTKSLPSVQCYQFSSRLRTEQNGAGIRSLPSSPIINSVSVVQRAAKFQHQDTEVEIQVVAGWIQANCIWAEFLSKNEIARILRGFADQSDDVYEVSKEDCDEIGGHLYDYWVESEQQDDQYDEDDQYDGLDSDDFIKKNKKGKNKYSRKDFRRLKEDSQRTEELRKEKEGIDNVLVGLKKERKGQKFDVAGGFSGVVKTALKGLSSSGKQKKITRYAEILDYGKDGLNYFSPTTFNDGRPGGFSSTYGMVPTERGDFTKLQYSIFNDVVYGDGATAVLVEWKQGDDETNKAQFSKINTLLTTLSGFGELSGSLVFFAVLNEIDEFNNATMMDYLMSREEPPVLSGGEAFDKTVYDKGAAFWQKHSKTQEDGKKKREHPSAPFLVIWFNRSNVEVEGYDENDDKAPGVKEQHLREMRHKTNIETMARIIEKYKGSRRIVFAGDNGASQEELGVVPSLDFRESWKLPGHNSILSQDETFDELAALSGQEVLHIGFRSGRLESLVMIPMQRVIMLENNVSVIGNARAARYYAYSKQGSVFNPRGLSALNIHPDTIDYANKLKEEEIQDDDPQRYGLPSYLPKKMEEEDVEPGYEEYFSKLDKHVKRQITPEVQDSLLQLVMQVAGNIETFLPKTEIDWTMDMTDRRAAFAKLKAAFNYLFELKKEDILKEIKGVIFLSREKEIKQTGSAIFRILIEYADKIDDANLGDVDAVGGKLVIKDDLVSCLEKLMVESSFFDALRTIRAIQAMILK